jgi:hypothetical protein
VIVDKTLKGFIGAYLNVEVASEGLEGTRDVLKTFNADAVESLKKNFAELLATRELTALDYGYMTYAEFESDEDLYTYLQAVYEYLFNDAENEPGPPPYE